VKKGDNSPELATGVQIKQRRLIYMADDVIRDVPMRLSDRFNLEKVSWGAIWGGTMVTIGLELLFLAFGIFIEAALGGGSTIWAIVWYLVTMGVSYYAGAWTAARLSDVSVRQVCVLHGLSTWGLSTLGTVILLGVATTTIMGFGRAAGLITLTQANLWGNTELYLGVVWGGIMLSFITAYLGGASGLPGARVSAQEEATVAPPIRRVG
jgi:hypothetical protein